MALSNMVVRNKKPSGNQVKLYGSEGLFPPIVPQKGKAIQSYSGPQSQHQVVPGFADESAQGILCTLLIV